MQQEMMGWQWHQLDHTLYANHLHLITQAPHHSIFYKPDAVPDTQPTVLKH